jgi:hypothetical protein
MLARTGMGAELVLLAIDDRRGGVRNRRRMGLVVAAAESGRTVLAIVRAALRAVAETAHRDNKRGDGERGDGGGSIAIPIDKQFGMQPGIGTALNNPNVT